MEINLIFYTNNYVMYKVVNVSVVVNFFFFFYTLKLLLNRAIIRVSTIKIRKTYSVVVIIIIYCCNDTRQHYIILIQSYLLYNSHRPNIVSIIYLYINICVCV